MLDTVIDDPYSQPYPLTGTSHPASLYGGLESQPGQNPGDRRSGTLNGVDGVYQWDGSKWIAYNNGDNPYANSANHDLGGNVSNPSAPYSPKSGGYGGSDLIDPSFLSPFTTPFVVPGSAQLPNVPNAAPFSYPDFQMPDLATLLGNDPGFQSRLKFGRQAVEQGAAAKGLLNSGGTLADVLGFGQDLASQESNSAFNRAFDIWGANRNNAADTYRTNYGSQTVDPFLFGSQNANTSYNRAQQEWQNQRDNFYRSQDAPFLKLFNLSNLGFSAANA